MKARYRQLDKPVLIGIKTQTMFFEVGERRGQRGSFPSFWKRLRIIINLGHPEEEQVTEMPYIRLGKCRRPMYEAALVSYLFWRSDLLQIDFPDDVNPCELPFSHYQVSFSFHLLWKFLLLTPLHIKSNSSFAVQIPD